MDTQSIANAFGAAPLTLAKAHVALSAGGGNYVRIWLSNPFFDVEHARSGEFDPERGARVGYGMGWAVARDGTFSHTGSDGTAAWVDPNEDLIVLVLTQTPEEESGRKVQVTMASDGAATVKHVAGKQYLRAYHDGRYAKAARAALEKLP